jgi:hypothetical protein
VRGFEALTVEAMHELRSEKDADFEVLEQKANLLIQSCADLRAHLERIEAQFGIADRQP